MKYRRHHTLISKLILWGSLLTLGVIASQTLVQVKQIECRLSSGQSCPSTIMTVLEQLRHEPLIFNTFDKQLTQLKFAQPTQIRIVGKRLPGTLVVNASLDPGLYHWDQTNWVATTDGELFVDEGKLLPNVQTIPPTNDPHSVMANYHQGLKTLITTFYQQDLSIDHILWQSDQKIIIFLSDELVVISDVENISSSAQKTKAIIEELSQQRSQAEQETKIDWRNQELDVRFRLPVLRKRP